MKKKYPASEKDKQDWIAFTNQKEPIFDKDSDLSKIDHKLGEIRKLDLHGYTLVKANKAVKEFVNKSVEYGCKKLLIVTGKGSRSKVRENPYVSEQMSVLKYSIPEFIKNDEDLSRKISRITKADLKNGGDGASYIFLKKIK